LSKDSNQKLAEWAGFRWYGEPIYGPGDGTPKGWHNPRGEACNGHPRFSADIKACFEWLVPELSMLGIGVTITIFDRRQLLWPIEGVQASLCRLRDGGDLEVKVREDIKGGDLGEATALALCTAVKELREKEQV